MTSSVNKEEVEGDDNSACFTESCVVDGKCETSLATDLLQKGGSRERRTGLGVNGRSHGGNELVKHRTVGNTVRLLKELKD